MTQEQMEQTTNGATTVIVQAPKKANWWKRIILIGVGGAVLTIGGCTGIVGLAAMGASEGEGTSASGEAATEEVAKTYEVGQKVKVSGASWTVIEAYPTKTLDSGYDSKRGNFVVVQFDFTNRGKEDVTLDTMHTTLTDSKGRESEPDTDSYGYVPDSQDIFLNQVNPGVTQRGTVIFTVAPGAHGFKFHGADMDSWSDETNDAKVALGF